MVNTVEISYLIEIAIEYRWKITCCISQGSAAIVAEMATYYLIFSGVTLCAKNY